MKLTRSMFLVSALAISTLLLFFLPADISFAKTDISIKEQDITFSKDVLLEGDSVTIYARVTNSGDTDVLGYVSFFDNGRQMSTPQPVSIRSNTYDDVFVSHQFSAGKHVIAVKIIAEHLQDDVIDDNSATKKEFFIDIDTDHDAIGDQQDPDIDNDNLSNEQEVTMGTNQYKADTDGDGISDAIDRFPLDKTEWRDSNDNGTGDNKDPDIDGDGILNQDEVITYGTNPVSFDTDNDGLDDYQELQLKTNPNKADTDGDSVKDFEDAFPLDPSQWQASLLDTLASRLKGNERYSYLGLGAASVIILFLLFSRRKKKK